MGQDFGSIADPSNQLSQTYKTIFQPERGARYLQMASIIFPPWFMQRIPLKRNYQIFAARKHIRKVCQDLIAHKRAQKSRTDHDIISVALESGGFDDEGLINQMMTFLVAGHETTSTALVWALYSLCKSPNVQTRLRQEIHDRLPSPRHAKDGARPHITSQDVDGMPYLAAVCNEVLRLWAPVTLTMRVADRDTTVLDHPVPKGTTVILCPLATNQSTASWGDDAGEFDPDRWLRTDGKGGVDSNYSFLTFIHGPRSCIGERFARAEFACLLAAWVGRFECEFEKEPEGELEIVGGITMKPKGGLWVRLKEVEDW